MKITDSEKARIALISIKNVIADDKVKPISKFRIIRDTCEVILKSLYEEQRKVTGNHKEE